MLHGLKSFKREFVGMLQQRDWMRYCGTESKTTQARPCSRQVVLTRYEVSYQTLINKLLLHYENISQPSIYIFS